MISIFSGLSLISLGIVFGWALISSFGVPGDFAGIITVIALSNSLSDVIIITLFALLGAITGDILSYELARNFSPYITKKLKKFKFYTNNEEKVRRLLNKYEFAYVFWTRFTVTGLGVVLNYLSGLEKIDRKKFIMATILGEIVYAIIYGILGYAFKETFNDLINVLNAFSIFIGAAIIVLILIFFILKRRRKIALSKNNNDNLDKPQEL